MFFPIATIALDPSKSPVAKSTVPTTSGFEELLLDEEDTVAVVVAVGLKNVHKNASDELTWNSTGTDKNEEINKLFLADLGYVFIFYLKDQKSCPSSLLIFLPERQSRRQSIKQIPRTSSFLHVRELQTCMMIIASVVFHYIVSKSMLVKKMCITLQCAVIFAQLHYFPFDLLLHCCSFRLFVTLAAFSLGKIAYVCCTLI